MVNTSVSNSKEDKIFMHTQKLMYLWSSEYRDAGKGFFLSEREWLVVLVPLIITITKCGCLLEQTKQIKTQMYSTTWPSLENSMNTMLEPFFFAKNDDRELRFIGTRQKFLDMQSRYKLMDHREARHQLQVLKLQLPKNSSIHSFDKTESFVNPICWKPQVHHDLHQDGFNSII